MIVGSRGRKETLTCDGSSHLVLICVYTSPPKTHVSASTRRGLTSAHVDIFPMLKLGDVHKKTCLSDALGCEQMRGMRSKYSHRLTKVDTGTDVFDKFPAFVRV